MSVRESEGTRGEFYCLTAFSLWDTMLQKATRYMPVLTRYLTALRPQGHSDIRSGLKQRESQSNNMTTRRIG